MLLLLNAHSYIPEIAIECKAKGFRLSSEADNLLTDVPSCSVKAAQDRLSDVQPSTIPEVDCFTVQSHKVVSIIT